MADLSQLGYSPETTEANTGFDALPAGEYPAVATEAELKDTKAGTGKYLKVTFEIIEGNGKGRKVFTNFNLVNPNQDAVQIGHAQLKEWATAAGNPNAKDTSELIHKPVVLKLTVKKDEEYGDGNEVKSYKPYGATVAQSQSAPAQASAAPTGNAPSWANQG